MSLTQFEEAVLPLYEQHRADWLEQARQEARLLAERHDFVTIEMVRERCPPPAGVDPRVMGAVFTRAEWENCGYVMGKRKESHGRPVAQFRRKSSNAANAA